MAGRPGEDQSADFRAMLHTLLDPDSLRFRSSADWCQAGSRLTTRPSH